MHINQKIDDRFTDELELYKKLSGLNLVQIFNEALTMYGEALKQRTKGYEVGLINEKKEVYKIFVFQGLQHTPLNTPLDESDIEIYEKESSEPTRILGLE